MHLDVWETLAGAVVGFTDGVTGMGGGALMTPIALAYLFGTRPALARAGSAVWANRGADCGRPR